MCEHGDDSQEEEIEEIEPALVKMYDLSDELDQTCYAFDFQMFALDFDVADPHEICVYFLEEYRLRTPHQPALWLGHWGWLFDRIPADLMLQCLNLFFSDCDRVFDATEHLVMCFSRLVMLIGPMALAIYEQYGWIVEDCLENMPDHVTDSFQAIRDAARSKRS